MNFPGKEQLNDLVDHAKAIGWDLLKIPWLAWKEIRLVRAQALGFVLVILYPLLAMTAVALMVSVAPGIPSGVSHAPPLTLGVVLPPTPLGNDLQNEISQLENIRIETFDSTQALERAMQQGRVRMGLHVESPPSDRSAIPMHLYYDNSNYVASTAMVAQVKTIVQNVGYKKSADILQTLLENLNTIQTALSNQVQSIDALAIELDAGDADINNLEKRITAIRLNDYEHQLNNYATMATNARNEIALTQNDADQAQSRIAKNLTKIRELRSDIQLLKNSFASALDLLDNAIETLGGPNGLPPAQALASLQNTIEQNTGQIDSIDQDLSEAENDLVATDSQITTAKNRLRGADASILVVQNNLAQYRNNLSEFQTLLETSQRVIGDSRTSKTRIKEDLAKARLLLGLLSERLGGLQNYDPGYLANPIHLTTTPLYAVSTVTTLVPFTLAFVLILTTLLLTSSTFLAEQKAGILYRVQTSATRMTAWLFGKIAGQSVIGLFEAALILALGILVFHVPLPANPAQTILAILVSTTSFVCLGLLITHFTKSPSNAILASLLLIVPMLFLSGILTPIEFMPDFIQGFARVLPLTASTELLSKAYLLGTPVLDNTAAIAPLLVLSITSLALSIILRRRESGAN